MTSLMSMFDPHGSFFSNWSILIFLIFFLSISKKWVVSSGWLTSKKIFMKSSNSNYFQVLFIGLFMFIFMNNFLGLIPFSFSTTSHFMFNVCVSYTLWLAGVLYSSIFMLKSLISHLTPQGCPLVLTPFMVLIELISLLIRFFTLALRLMANVMAGHLILSLVGSSFCLTNLFVVFPSLLVLVAHSMLFMFEMAVAMIQSYVFSMLMIMYWNE